jgi:GntR family transcriptional repressor for pyruvate dehydrogenase complex
MSGLSTFVRRSVSVSDEIVAHIETLISSGSLTPGTKLPPERELAEVLSVSRVSLREAMHELERRRVIERRPGRGTVVLEAPEHARAFRDGLSAAERTLRDVAELRETLEPKIAQLAAERASAATLHALESVLARSAQELPVGESVEADITFHMLLAQASQNPLMMTASVREFSHATEKGRRESHRGHQLIFEAVHCGDGEAARAAMLAHLADVAVLTMDAYPAFLPRAVSPSARHFRISPAPFSPVVQPSRSTQSFNPAAQRQSAAH